MPAQELLNDIQTALESTASRIGALATAVGHGNQMSISARLRDVSASLDVVANTFDALGTALANEPVPAEYKIEMQGAQVILDRPATRYVDFPNRYRVEPGTRVLRVVNDEGTLGWEPRVFGVEQFHAPDGTFPEEILIPHHEPVTSQLPQALDFGTFAVFTRRTEAERAAAGESDDESFIHDVLVIQASTETGPLAPPLYGRVPFIYDSAHLILWLDALPALDVDEAEAQAAINSLGLLTETEGNWTQRLTHASAQVPEYGRDIATLIGDVGMALHCKALPSSLRLAGLHKLLQIGIDASGYMQAARWRDSKPFEYPADGGHGNGRYYPMMLAKELLLIFPSHVRVSELGQTYEDAQRGPDWRMRPGMETDRHTTYPPRSPEEKAEKYRELAVRSIASTLVPMYMQNLTIDYVMRAAIADNMEHPAAPWSRKAYGLAGEWLLSNPNPLI